MILQLRNQQAAEAQEMVLNDPNHMESVRNDFGVGEPLSNQLPIGRREINADHFDLFAVFESA